MIGQEQYSVVALILTHNAPRSLSRCLAAIAGQSQRPDAVILVDNASTPPATSVTEGLERIRVIRNQENLGPAGGHAIGLRAFLDSDAQAAWVMDDDCIPAPGCLERLVSTAQRATEPTLILPHWIDESSGETTNWPGWCGFLISRAIVETVGLPRKDYFWWAEDTEYLQWRIPRAGMQVFREHRAVVLHARIGSGRSKPPWKIYYEVRNSVHYRLYVQEGGSRRFYRLFKVLARTFGRILLEDRRRLKLIMYGRGVVDGFLGRLGRTVEPSSKDQREVTSEHVG